MLELAAAMEGKSRRKLLREIVIGWLRVNGYYDIQDRVEFEEFINNNHV